jgi:hypothetical protein
LVSTTLVKSHFLHYLLFRKTSFFRGIPLRSVPFRASELALPRNSECLGMSTFFRGITETIPSLFRGIFSERKFRSQPYVQADTRLSWSLSGDNCRAPAEGLIINPSLIQGPRAQKQETNEELINGPRRRLQIYLWFMC